MEREQLLQMILKIRDVLDSSVSDTQVEKLTFGYLDGGYIDLGFPDLARSQAFMNVVFIVIDKLRKVIHEKSKGIIQEGDERTS